MTMILYNVPDGCVHPTTMPDVYSVTVPVPPFVAKNNKNIKLGRILINAKDITSYPAFPELKNIQLADEVYSLSIRDNNTFKNVYVSALDILLSYDASILAKKEDEKINPVLHDVPKTHLIKWDNTNYYQLKIMFPKRLRPYFNVPTEHYSAQVIIPCENIKHKTSRSFDITLTNTIYTVIIDIDDNTRHHQIARSELIEAYTNQQAIRAELMIDRVKDTMSVDDTMGQTLVLRHIFKKNIEKFDNDTMIVAVSVPKSLKDKCSKWFCSITVPAHCVKDEIIVNNHELVTVTLTKKTYDVSYPVSETRHFHDFKPVQWKTATVTSKELYDTHMKELKTFPFYRANHLK